MNKECVFYDEYKCECLMTIIIARDKFNYILAEIHNHRNLKTMCSKLIFTRLYFRFKLKNTFIFNIKFCKQRDGCTMGRPLSVVFSDTCIKKLEMNTILSPKKPKNCKRFDDDVFARGKTNIPNKLLQFLNN